MSWVQPGREQPICQLSVRWARNRRRSSGELDAARWAGSRRWISGEFYLRREGPSLGILISVSTSPLDPANGSAGDAFGRGRGPRRARGRAEARSVRASRRTSGPRAGPAAPAVGSGSVRAASEAPPLVGGTRGALARSSPRRPASSLPVPARGRARRGAWPGAERRFAILAGGSGAGPGTRPGGRGSRGPAPRGAAGVAAAEGRAAPGAARGGSRARLGARIPADPGGGDLRAHFVPACFSSTTCWIEPIA